MWKYKLFTIGGRVLVILLLLAVMAGVSYFTYSLAFGFRDSFNPVKLLYLVACFALFDFIKWLLSLALSVFPFFRDKNKLKRATKKVYSKHYKDLKDSYAKPGQNFKWRDMWVLRKRT